MASATRSSTAPDVVGEGFGNGAHHVRLGPQIGVCCPGGPSGLCAASKRSSAASVGAGRCNRMFAQAMVSCSRGRPKPPDCGWQFLDDLEQRGHLRLLEQACLVLLDEINRAGSVARGQRMVDGLVEGAVFGEPRRRGVVKFRSPGRGGHVRVGGAGIRRTCGGSETSSGHRRLAAGTSRAARPARTWPARVGTRQRGRQPAAGAFGDRCCLQELAQLGFEGVEDIFGQEVADQHRRQRKVGPPGCSRRGRRAATARPVCRAAAQPSVDVVNASISSLPTAASHRHR